MNIFGVIALLCGVALYLLMLGASLWLAISSDKDPDVRFGGIFLSLIIIGFTCLALGGA